MHKKTDNLIEVCQLLCIKKSSAPCFIFLRNQRLIAALTTVRVQGINKRNPHVSLKNPGVMRRTAPSSTQMPSRIASLGTSPFRIWICANLMASAPCLLASDAPITPVKMISPTVGHTPIKLPARISNPISNAEKTIKNTARKRNLISLCESGYRLMQLRPLFLQ